MPRVTILLTSPRPAERLPDTIDRVLRQTFGDFELRICAPDPDEAVRRIALGNPDGRIAIGPADEAQGPRLGVAEVAAPAASDYVATLRSGEVWETTRLERQVAYLDARPDLGAVLALEPGAPHPAGESAAALMGSDDRLRRAWLRQLFVGRWPQGPLGLLVRRQRLRDAGGYRRALAQSGEAELLSRLLIRGPVGVIGGEPRSQRVSEADGVGTADVLEAAIRERNEWNLLRENYLSLSSFEDLAAIFPSLERFRSPGGFDTKFLLAMACLHECDQQEAWQLGLRWLLELVDGNECHARIRALYGFSYPDLIRLTGEVDVYGRDWARLVADWDQDSGSAWEKLVADRDWLIDQRRWLVDHRQWLLSERDWLIAERERFRAEVFNSASWRLTRPVRLVGQALRRWRASIAALGTDREQASGETAGETMVKPAGQDAAAARAPVLAMPTETTHDVGAGTTTLLVLHEFSRTGAPYAALYLARALVSCCGVKATILSPQEGPLRQEFEREGFTTMVDASWSGDGDPSTGLRAWVSGFDRVIVNSLAAFPFIERFGGQARRLTWWIHETAVGFDSVVTMTSDLSALFAACESVWLASPLCFPLAARYAASERLHLLLYGCPDRALPHRPHPSGKTVFLIVGSVERRKGQDVFLDAIERLDEDLRRKALFRIVGSPLPNNPESAVFSLKVRSRAARLPQVRWFGNMPLQRLHDLYAEADAIVSASRDDPMPIVITEGLMHATACLCSSAVGQAQLLEDGKDGLIFASESAEELSRKMAWVLQHPTELAALGRAGRAVYERHFLPSAFAENVGELLKGSAAAVGSMPPEAGSRHV